MEGATWNGGYADVLPELAGSEWMIVGVADFNNDTQPDLLWRNTTDGRTTIWYMNGSTWSGGYADVEPTLNDPNWSIVGIADFNKDGSQDLLWRSSSSGRTTIWYMTGPTWNGGYADVEPTLSDPNWSIVGIADFNKDGSPDLLWRDASSGRTTIWYMTGPTWNGGYADVEPTVSDPAWQIVAIRDFNGDGSPDLLWRNASTYRTTVWYMNGPIWNGNWGDLLPIVSDPNWIIVGK
jgi:DMSO/TMAO reductase YedYZ molybdopterin-dependent catalytic subunit